MKKKGWTSLTVKLNTLIIIIVLVLSIGLAAFAYEVNKSRVDSYYKQTIDFISQLIFSAIAN